jgi:2-polyprenyl-3-methyl-5-hydroxy-6-metoxy-1,4-benzoquinol methylase
MKSSLFRDRLYASYATSHTGQEIGDISRYEQWARDFKWRLKGLLPTDRKAVCLDLACGAGFFLYYLRKQGYLNITGVDVSPEQVKLARQVCDEVHENGIQEFLTSGGRYDLITMFSIIEHLTRDEAVVTLDAVNSALRPGGRLILILPNADSPFAAHMRYGDVTHEVIYNSRSLSSLLKVCGFTDCRAFGTGPIPRGIISSIRWLLWQGIVGLLRFFRLVEGGSSRGWIFTTEIIMIAEKTRN